MNNKLLDQFAAHNRFHESIKAFEMADPQLAALKKLTYKFEKFTWWDDLDLDVPGIYMLAGGRQVGKSTSCKMLIHHALKLKKFEPKNIFYLPCDAILKADYFLILLREFLKNVTGNFLLVIDEVTYVDNWDRMIKALADEGAFRQGVCLVTGSDTTIIQQASARFPGRRGKANKVDFILHPLSFHEYVDLRLKRKKSTNELLFELFDDYLKCGGYLPAINELAEGGAVDSGTRLIYQQWILQDAIKHGKSESILKRLVHALLTTGVSQLSYTKLNHIIGETSKTTCIDYCDFLENIGVMKSFMAFNQNVNGPFLKKERKFHFADPFIYHVLFDWLQSEGLNNTPPDKTTLVEATVAHHCHRFGPTYYYKSDTGEIDVIWYQKPHFRAIEVKWSKQLRAGDLKTLKKFDPKAQNTLILSRSIYHGEREGIVSAPLVEFLYHLPEGWPVE